MRYSARIPRSFEKEAFWGRLVQLFGRGAIKAPVPVVKGLVQGGSRVAPALRTLSARIPPVPSTPAIPIRAPIPSYTTSVIRPEGPVGGLSPRVLGQARRQFGIPAEDVLAVLQRGTGGRMVSPTRGYLHELANWQRGIQQSKGPALSFSSPRDFAPWEKMGSVRK